MFMYLKSVYTGAYEL